MNDVRLWELLTPGILIDSGLEQERNKLLETLVELGPRARFPFASRILNLRAENDPAIAELQAKILSGFSGWTSWEFLLEKTHDQRSTVREAAVDSLLQCSIESPWVLAFLVFHSNPEVRIYALQKFVVKSQRIPAMFLHLLNDESCRSSVEKAIVKLGITRETSPRVVAEFARAGALSTNAARTILGQLAPREIANCLQQLPAYSHVEVHAILKTESYARIGSKPIAGDYDGLQWFCELYWDFDDVDETGSGTGRGAGDESHEQLDIVNSFLDSLLQLLLTDSNLGRHFVAACLITAYKTKKWNHRLAGICAACDPMFLVRPHVPREVRRSATDTLYQLREQVVEIHDESQFAQLLQDAAFRRENGQLDLRMIGGALFYRRKWAFRQLVEIFRENELVTAFLNDPVDSAPLFSYGGSGKQAEHLISAIRSQRKKVGPLLDAMLLFVLPASRLNFFEKLNDPETIKLLDKVRELLDTRSFQINERKLVVIGELLAKRINIIFVVQFLEFWLTSSDPSSFAVGLEFFAHLGRNREIRDDLFAYLESLDAERLRKTLACVQKCSGFPYGAEVALGRRLLSHPDEEVRSWAEARVPTDSPPADEKVTTVDSQLTVDDDGTCYVQIGLRVATRIESCPDADLKNAVVPCLDAPTRGLCPALAKRLTPTKPIPYVATAILGCADPLVELDQQFLRFGSEEAKFLEKLDLLMAGAWQKLDGLHLMASAWLWRWEKRIEEFAELAMKTSRQTVELLVTVNQLKSKTLARQFWLAIHRALGIWRYRQPDRYVAFLDLPFLEAVADQLDEPFDEIAAEILVKIHGSHRVNGLMNQLRSSVYDRLPDFRPNVRKILQPWINSSGSLQESVVARKKVQDLDEDQLAKLNRCTDVDQLIEWCRSPESNLATNAAIRCVSLGGKWLDRMIDLFTDGPAPAHLIRLADTVSLWPDEFVDKAIELVGDPRIDKVTQFLVGLNLIERNVQRDGLGNSLVDTICEIACEPIVASWFQKSDLRRLRSAVKNDRRLALLLATSPHPHAYRFSIDELLEGCAETHDYRSLPKLDDASQTALRRFLACGQQRMTSLRRMAASALLKSHDNYGYPILLAAESENENRRTEYMRAFPAQLAEESMESALLAGHKIFPEIKLLELLDLRANASDKFQAAAIELNKSAISNSVRERLARRMKKGISRSQKLKNVAEAFAWGIPIARELTGKLFSIEMIGGDDHGYTRLHENKVYINPLAILQRKPHGREIVEGLILHELGHHMYHRGKSHQAVWDTAHEDGLGKLLNLVSDEHLERNIRAIDRRFGDRLKRLGAHVFQHSTKEIHHRSLLDALHVNAFTVLSNNRMRVARRPECIKLMARDVLTQMELQGNSFSRFFRALRLGLGNRHNDAKVGEALKLFGKSFRKCSMKQLYEITLKLREIFGSECDLLNCVGQNQILGGEDSQIMIDGEGITNNDIQSEIQRISNPEKSRQGPSSKGKPTRWINVSEELEFEPIETVRRVSASQSEHAKYVQPVIRYAHKLRQYLGELGLVMVPKPRRLRGSKLDRAGLPSAIIKRDPRILKLREPEFRTDLFIGMCIDCSGSMEYDDNIEKAKMFGALLTEAVKGMGSVDLRIFGFTDVTIFDAGNAHRTGLANLNAGGGNNDAAALLHAAQTALMSQRKAKLLVMISDGLPTECSTEALKNLVETLTNQWKMCCAQVAVQPLEEICFPNYVLLDTSEPSAAVRDFGLTVARLVRKSMGG